MSRVYNTKHWHSSCVIVPIFLLFTIEISGNSLATSSNIRLQREIESEGCILPGFQEFGTWKLSNSEAKPGDIVPYNTAIKFECTTGYKLTTSCPYLVCGDNWSPTNIPNCEPLCPSLSFPKGTDYRCTSKESQVIDCSEAVNGSKITFTCPKGYKNPKEGTSTAKCNDGSWEPNQPECQLLIEDCGKKVEISDELTTSGLEYPWNVFLYEKEYHENSTEEYIYLCGATLLSHKVVLTGGICVTDSLGKILPKERYLIGAGKLLKKYKDPSEVQTQYTEVSKIITHKSYRAHHKYYLGDIALLVAKTCFTFDNFVRPACFYNINNIRLHPGDLGVLRKYSKNNEQEIIEIPFQDSDTCRKEFPESFAEKYQLDDKICIGYDNKTSSLCRRGSGAGFTVRNPEDGRYYVHGLASVGPYNPDPDGTVCHHFKLYTNVSYYYDFIEKVLTENQ